MQAQLDRRMGSISLRRQVRGWVTSALLVLATLVALFTLMTILLDVVSRGLPHLNVSFLVKTTPAPGLSGGGVLNAIIGTLSSVGVASLLAIPIGLLSAIFAVEFATPRIKGMVLGVATTLSGLPSIIAGVWAYSVLIQPKIVGFSPIAGGVALAVVMIPLVTRSSADALGMVPHELRMAALGLGAYRHEVILRMTLPAATSGIATGVLLAIARASGETAPLVLTMLFSPFMSIDLTRPMASLSVLIYNFSTMPYKSQQEMAWAASLLLIGMVLGLSLGVRTLLKKDSSRKR